MYYKQNYFFNVFVNFKYIIVVFKNSSVPKEYSSLGGPYVKCVNCEAFMWKEERANKEVTRGVPRFSICCGKGKVKLTKTPPTPSYLWKLYNDPKKGPLFHRCSRIYNSMFAFTSTGGYVDNSINKGGSPYVYRLNGINHHMFGSLIPNNGEDPKFCQLYIYDTVNEVKNRMKWVDVKESEKLDEEIVRGLLQMLDECNVLVKRFRMACDRFENNEIYDLDIFLKVCHSESGRENNIGASNEVGVVMVGEQQDPEGDRDIIVEDKVYGLHRITTIDPKLMALQYPLLFPTGEDGFHKDLYYEHTDETRGRKRQKLTLKDFYSYKLHVRHSEGMLVVLNLPCLTLYLFFDYIM